VYAAPDRKVTCSLDLENTGNTGLSFSLDSTAVAAGTTLTCASTDPVAAGDAINCTLARDATQDDFEAAYLVLEANGVQAARSNPVSGTYKRDVTPSASSIAVPLVQAPALDLQVSVLPTTVTSGSKSPVVGFKERQSCRVTSCCCPCFLQRVLRVTV
jgi:hypothetical protein